MRHNVGWRFVWWNWAFRFRSVPEFPKYARKSNQCTLRFKWSVRTFHFIIVAKKCLIMLFFGIFGIFEEFSNRVWRVYDKTGLSFITNVIDRLIVMFYAIPSGFCTRLHSKLTVEKEKPTLDRNWQNRRRQKRYIRAAILISNVRRYFMAQTRKALFAAF